MADEWLPDDPVPDQKVPGQSRATRTIVVWLVLLVMFIAIYSLFSTDGSPSPTPAGYRGAWIWIAAIAGFATPIVFIVWQLGGTKKFNQAQAAGLEALARGKPLAAAEHFAALARKTRTRPAHHAVASYNYGYALLRGGESAKAVGILLRVERTPKLQIGGIKTLTPIALARAFALGGDIAKANVWLETARSRPILDNAVYGRALLASIEALVRCREGKYAEAITVLDANWQIIEHYLSIDLIAEPWLLRAFAIMMQSTVRDAAAAEPWLRALRILSPEQSRWLTHHWPELGLFATTHDVLRASPSIAEPVLAPVVEQPAPE